MGRSPEMLGTRRSSWTPLPWRAPSLSIAAVFFAGCGAGTAAIVASTGGGGGGNSPPAISGFQVKDTKVAPARLRFVLADPEANPVQVALFARIAGLDEPLAQVTDPGFPSNPATLATSRDGIEYELEWDFPAEAFLPDDAHFVEDVTAFAQLGGGAQQLVAGGNSALVGMGNDAPVVLSIDQIDIDPQENQASGTTGIEFTVADSSGDLVSVKVEYDISGDVPDAGWRLARPDLLDPGEPTPEFGLEGIQVSSEEQGGTTLAFHWDTDADLEDLERDVQVRLTATDGVATGSPLASPAFRVDNNDEPIVQLDSGPLILDPDERRGIAVPYTVIDEEGDEVEVFFQWRRPDEEFPDLSAYAGALDALLADPSLRRENHICTPYTYFARGRAVPVDATSLRLPELASPEGWVRTSRLELLALELLRPSSIPAPIAAGWTTNPLAAPVAALPAGDGLNALVLDAPGGPGGTGRLREIELATGAIVRAIATLAPGAPGAMAYEPGARRVLVATDLNGVWQVERVELATGEVRVLHAAGPASEPGPIRGLAVLGTGVAVATIGSSLVRLDHTDPLAPRETTVLSGLSTPWGVAVDPLGTNRVVLAERDAPLPGGAAGRILVVELDTYAQSALVVNGIGTPLQVLGRPETLAFERGGARILLVSQADGEPLPRLVGLDLGADGSNAAFAIGPQLPATAASVASGPDGLRLLALPGQDQLLVAGGLEQRREIATYDPSTQRAVVESPFAPLPSTGQPWRISGNGSVLASPEGRAARFVWDSADVPGGGAIHLRAYPRDAELGATAQTGGAKTVRAGLDSAPIAVGDSSTLDFAFSVACADLDGDGDLDLASANLISDDLTAFFQTAPGSFDPLPVALGGFPTMDSPSGVAAADLDGDGDLELVSANQDSDDLAIFFQDAPGSFDPTPLALGRIPSVDRPACVEAADLDGDGDLDLVSANQISDNLTAFFQIAPGSFDPTPLVLGDTSITDLPASLAVDLDGDGDNDIISANARSSDLTVFFQVAPGDFDPDPLTIGGPDVTYLATALAAADLDGDGDVDLASSNVGSRNLTVFFQDAPGSFAPEPFTLGGLPTSFPGTLQDAADMDGDGDNDLITAGDDDRLKVLFQTAPGSFDPSLVTHPFPYLDSPITVRAADVDGDGRIDLVSANAVSDNLTLFLHSRPVSLDPAPLVVQEATTTRFPLSCTAADLDEDGDLDLASANLGADNITVFFQAGAGVFEVQPLQLGGIAVMENPYSLAAADLDGDGDLDLATANAQSDDVTAFFQDAPGSFDPLPLTLGSSSTTRNPTDVEATDLDGDGDLDLISANFSISTLAVFLQTAAGTFDPTPRILADPSMRNPEAVAVADIDRDGDRDLVATTNDAFGGPDLIIFHQTGPLAFEPLALGSASSGAQAVAVADMDGDGLLDLASGNAGTDDLTIFFQEPAGDFDPAPVVLAVPPGGFPGSDPRSIALADLDGDGDLDLVSANFYRDDLTIFSQLLPGVFGATPRALGGLPLNDGCAWVVAADIDGDGDLDLACANFESGGMTVFWGGR